MLLRYLWSNPFHLMVSLHRLSQFSKPQFLCKHQTLREKQLLALSCQEINQYVSCVWFFTSREGVVGFLPFFGVAFTHPYSLCSPTLTLGGVNAGSPEALNRSPQPESTWPVCELWVTFYFLTTPGWKHVNLQTLPRLQIRVAAEKRVELQIVQPLWFISLMQFQFFDVSFDGVFSVQCFALIGVCSDINFETNNKMANTTATNKNTKTNISLLSVMRNQILPHRLVVCMWK